MPISMTVRLHPFRWLACLSVFLLSTLTATAARAQLGEYSVSELTGFAFYGMAKVEPDFHSWIVNSERYLDADVAERQIMLRMDQDRLSSGFDSYKPREMPIELSIRAKMKMPSPNIINKMIKDTGRVQIPIRVADNKGAFFAIPVGEIWVALIPKDFESFLTVDLGPAELNELKARLKNSNADAEDSSDITISMDLVPLQIDTKSPIQAEGFYLWTMMAEITSFDIWSHNKKRLLWSYSKKGYVSKSEKNISNLFDN